MSMDSTPPQKDPSQVTAEDVRRVLEFGKILLSVLTEEELAELATVLNSDNTVEIDISSTKGEFEIGNTGEP